MLQRSVRSLGTQECMALCCLTYDPFTWLYTGPIVYRLKRRLNTTALLRSPTAACLEPPSLLAAAPRLQERQTLTEAEDLLKKLGFKGSLFAAPQQGQQQGADGQPPGQQQQSSGNES